MHFSSMAVSVLAQAMPLLAVGYRAGWNKRERSLMRSGSFRAVLLEGVHEKQGIVLEKRVGVHGKQDDVLEKKRAGSSAHLVQDSVSSEVPSTDREASVECDPLFKVTDSGIFGCGMDSHCVESKESKLGGFCVALRQPPSVNRALQQLESCVEGPDENGLTCDCSQYDDTSGVGTYTCAYPEEFCLDESGMVCDIDFSITVNADGSTAFVYCYHPTDGDELVDSVCYSIGYTALGVEETCEIKINTVVCNSCAFEQEKCPGDALLTVLDCTNTVINTQVSTCGSALDYDTASPSASPMPSSNTLESMMPSTAVDESSEMPLTVSVDTEMPSTVAGDTNMPTTEAANSSGGSLTAKMTIVVSAAVTAWLASFGI